MSTFHNVVSVLQGKPGRPGRSLYNYAVSRAGSISAFAPNCKRVRFRKNDCLQCLDACPENAIALNPGPEISQACTECGLCVSACPTEALRDDSRRERRLWQQAAQLRTSQADEHKRRVLSVGCHKVASHGKDALSIHCLGNITSYLLAALAFIGYEEVRFKKGACSICRLMRGEKLFARSVQTARMLLEGVKPGSFVIHVEAGSRQETLLDRRRLFSPVATVFGSMRRDADTTGSGEAADSMSGKKLIYHLLEHGSIQTLPRINYSPDLPWGRVAIDGTLCSGCGICAAVCATGALAETTQEGCRIIHLDSALCLNCRLCIDACSQKAARFEEDFILARGSPDGAQVLARIKLPTCDLCGDPMRAGGGRLCPTCERRQLTPLGTRAQASCAESGPEKLIV